jgi:hypothetical protein
MICKKITSAVITLSLIAILFSTPSVVYANDNYTAKKCISTVKYDRITNTDKLLKLAIDQSEEKNDNAGINELPNNIMCLTGNDVTSTENDVTSTENNGIIAKQLVEERTYSDGSIEQDYEVDNFALENVSTGDTITYYSSSLYKSVSNYNVVASQTLYYTLKLYEVGCLDYIMMY